MTPIAHIHNAFEEKFGIPRQSGLAKSARAQIVFTPEYRNPDALRGLDGFSYIWLIWEFSEAVRDRWSPTVRPPRLGGNVRMGVFATRSPFRPNSIGLSSVRLERIDLHTPDGPVLHVSGADLMNGTPIYDIKPYIPADCHPEAAGGFVAEREWQTLSVELPPSLLTRIPEAHRDGLRAALEQDPRPSYQHDPERVYGMRYAGCNVRFSVRGQVLTVLDIQKL